MIFFCLYTDFGGFLQNCHFSSRVIGASARKIGESQTVVVQLRKLSHEQTKNDDSRKKRAAYPTSLAELEIEIDFSNFLLFFYFFQVSHCR